MKRNLLGLFAVVLAVAFSAFTSAKHNNSQTTLYWFTANATFGDETVFTANQVTSLNVIDDDAPTGICNDAPEFKCVLGFDISDVNVSGSNYSLKIGTHSPDALGEKRDTE